MLPKFILKGMVPNCCPVHPKKIPFSPWSSTLGSWKFIPKTSKKREKKLCHAEFGSFSFFFWFCFRVGWVAVVTRWWQSSVTEKFLAWKGECGVCVPLHDRTGLKFADDGPMAALEMVKDWIFYKQCWTPLHPACTHTAPAACSTVGLNYVEAG